MGSRCSLVCSTIPESAWRDWGKLQKVILKIWSWTENRGGKKAVECVTFRHDIVGDTMLLFFRLNTLEYNTDISSSVSDVSQMNRTGSMCNRRSVHSRPSLFTCSCFIILLNHRRIILTTLMHCVVSPLLIHVHTCVDACSNTKEAVSAHLSHSVTIMIMCLTVCT